MFRESVFLWLANHLPHGRFGTRARYEALRFAGMKLAPKVIVMGPISISPPGTGSRVTIGSRTFINANVRFGAKAGVTIGRFAQIAPDVSFETSSHDLSFTDGRSRADKSLPVVVHDHVWIGTGAIILPGVTIGRGAVVAAGAVVTRDVPARTLVAGVPAKTLRDVQESFS